MASHDDPCGALETCAAAVVALVGAADLASHDDPCGALETCAAAVVALVRAADLASHDDPCGGLETGAAAVVALGGDVDADAKVLSASNPISTYRDHSCSSTQKKLVPRMRER